MLRHMQVLGGFPWEKVHQASLLSSKVLLSQIRSVQTWNHIILPGLVLIRIITKRFLIYLCCEKSVNQDVHYVSGRLNRVQPSNLNPASHQNPGVNSSIGAILPANVETILNFCNAFKVHDGSKPGMWVEENILKSHSQDLTSRRLSSTVLPTL